MADQKNLEIAINAVNNASKQLDDVTKSLGGVSTASDKANTAQGSMSKAVFNGVAMWDLAKGAFRMASGFISESIELAKEAELTTVKYNAVLNSIPNLTEQARQATLSYGNSLLQYGVDNEQATLYTAKFLKATGDVGQSQHLMKTALDLTASGYGTLESNVDNLSKVLVGKGTRALMEYKVNLKDGATTAEQLDAIQKKATTSIEDWAKTTEGKTGIMKEKFNEVKEGLGGGFLPVINSVADAGMGLLDALIADSQGANIMGNTLAVVSNFLIGLGQTVWTIIKIFGNFGAGLILVGDIAWNFVKTVWDNFKNFAKNLGLIFKAMFEGISGNFEGAKNTLASLNEIDTSGLSMSMDAFNNNAQEAGKSVGELQFGIKKMFAGTQGANNLKFDIQGAKDGFNNVKDATGNAGAGVDELAQKMTELKDKMKDTVLKGVDAFDELQKKIIDIQTQMGQLSSENALNKFSDQEDLAKAYADQETKVADLAKELSQKKADYNTKMNESVTSDNIVSHNQEMAKLQTELDAQKATYDKEKQALEAHSTILIAYGDKVADARRVNNLTDFEKTLETTNKKMLLAQDEFNNKMESFQKELTAEQIKQATVKALQEQALKEADKFLAQGEKQTADSVNKEIAYYNALADAIARAKAGQRSSSVALASGTDKRATASTAVTVNINAGNVVGDAGIKALANLVSNKVGQMVGANAKLTN